MNIRRILIATLAVESGCFPFQDCGERVVGDFEVDDVLRETDIAYLMEKEGVTEADEIQCETACQYRVDTLGGDQEILEITNCDFIIDSGDTSDENGGVIQCDGSVEYKYICKGRRPLGHVEAPADLHTLGGHLAHSAHLEAASVVAFLQLARQLAGLGAPAGLIARCRQAAAEEAAHTRLFATLARQEGATVPPVRCEPAADDLLAIALNNALEGCVGEAWAALQAQWQAQHSPDPRLRGLFSRLAADEAGHAQLAWDLHGWLVQRLSPGERVAVQRALRAALEALPMRVRLHAATSPAALGLPSPQSAAELAARFSTFLAA